MKDHPKISTISGAVMSVHKIRTDFRTVRFRDYFRLTTKIKDRSIRKKADMVALIPCKPCEHARSLLIVFKLHS